MTPAKRKLSAAQKPRAKAGATKAKATAKATATKPARRTAAPRPKAAAPQTKANEPRTKATAGAIDRTDLASVLATAPYPTDAAGLGRARGLGVNAGVDAWLGIGFPYAVIPTDEPMLRFETCGAFARAYPDDAHVLPREAVLQQYVVRVPKSPAMPFLTDADPVPPVRKIALGEAVKRALAYHDGRKIQLLEVMFGARALAEEIVSQLVALPLAKWANDRGVPAVISAGLRWLLWRVPLADRERLRGKLEDTWSRIRSGVHARGGRALDVLLHGRVGVERSGSHFNGALHLYDLVSADDDPQWALDQALAIVRRLRPADRERFDPQLVVLCGEKLLTAFRSNVDKLLAADRDRTRRLLALFA